MPFALIIIGLLMIITAGQNTHVQMAQQLRTDGTAFTKWMVAFGMVGALGYVEDLRGLSRAFMTLMLVALVLSNSKSGKGLFGNFQAAIDSGPASITPAADTGTPAAASNGQSGDANPMNQGVFGQSSEGMLGNQAPFNNTMNSLFKFFTGGYSQ